MHYDAFVWRGKQDNLSAGFGNPQTRKLRLRFRLRPFNNFRCHISFGLLLFALKTCLQLAGDALFDAAKFKLFEGRLFFLKAALANTMADRIAENFRAVWTCDSVCAIPAGAPRTLGDLADKWRVDELTPEPCEQKNYGDGNYGCVEGCHGSFPP